MDDGPYGTWQVILASAARFAFPYGIDHREAVRRSAMANPCFTVSQQTVHNLMVKAP